MIPDLAALTNAIPLLWGTWTILGAGCIGLGALFLTVAGGRRGEWTPRRVGWALTAWLGLAVAVAVLQVAHLFLPVDHRAVALLATLSIAGWIFAGRSLRGEVLGPAPVAELGTRAPHALFLVLFLLVVWMAAVRATGPSEGYDSANYHLPLVRWFAEFPLPPGLANLSPFFGINLSGLLLAALVDRGPISHASQHVLNGFIVCLLVALILERAGRAWRQKEGPATAWLWIFLLAPATAMIHYANGFLLTTLSTEVLAVLSALVAWAIWLEEGWSTRGLDEAHRHTTGSLAWTVPPLAALALTAKASTLAFAGLLLAACLPWTARAMRSLSRSTLSAFGLAGVLLLGWAGRSVVQSGVPLFPLSLLGFPVDWRVRSEILEGVSWNVQAWARTPGVFEAMDTPFGDPSWIRIWWANDFRAALVEAWLPLGASITLLAVAGFAVLRRSAGSRSSRRSLLWPIVILGSSFVLWWISAPSTRYGQFLFWSLALLSATVALDALRGHSWLHSPRVLVTVATAWFLVPMALHAHYAGRTSAGFDFEAMQGAFTERAGAGGSLPELPQVAAETVRICGGAEIRRPTEQFAPDSLNWPRALPWAMAAPSTNYPPLGVCARQTGSIAAGFRPEPAEATWSRVFAGEIAATAKRTGWSRLQLAYFYVATPEAIDQALVHSREGDSP